MSLGSRNPPAIPTSPPPLNTHQVGQRLRFDWIGQRLHNEPSECLSLNTVGSRSFKVIYQ